MKDKNNCVELHGEVSRPWEAPSKIGSSIKVKIFGGSHTPCIGVDIEGLPQGLIVDKDALRGFMERRRANNNAYSTTRIEGDEVVFESGLIDGFTSGTTLRAIIRNTNIKPKDYQDLLRFPRPSHADYVAKIKYGDDYDATGGGAFSGRMTACMCIVGGIAKQILKGIGIEVMAGTSSIGDISCGDYADISKEVISHDFYAINEDRSLQISSLIEDMRKDTDSIGGTISCKVTGMPIGVGGAMFDGLEGDIAKAIYGIPAIKGIEFGAGFDVAKMYGSKANDQMYYDGEIVKCYTNYNGGIVGGISNGMDITFKVAVKPTPSIAKLQHTVDLENKVNSELQVKGRHDVCIVPRAVCVVEAMAAFAILDRIIGEDKLWK